MPRTPRPNVLTVTAAARHFSCSRPTVYAALEDGRLTEAVDVGVRSVLRDRKFDDFEPNATGRRARLAPTRTCAENV